MMSHEEFTRRAGFDLHGFVKNAKSSLGVGKVRVMFDNPNAQAMSRYNGEVLEVHLPDNATIKRQRPELSDGEVVAKIKAATIEELCHGKFHETDHNDDVVSCTINGMKSHMSAEEMAYPYIKQKVERLQAASRPIAGESL